MLKTSSTLQLISFIGTVFGLTSLPVQAATISFSDPVPNAGISYEWTVEMSNTDAVQMTRYVGAKSWNEPLNPVGLKGWTHTSNWVALNLTQLTQLTVKVDRTAGVKTPTGVAGDSLYPAFSLFSGWQNSGIEDHQFNTLGNTSWADELSYLDHEGNDSAASSVLKKFVLPAGFYSIAIGSNPPNPSLTGLHGYTATLTTTPVPEPATNGILTTIAVLSLLSYSRRKSPIS